MGRGGIFSGILFSDNFTLLAFDHMVSFLVMCYQLIFFSGRHWESGVWNVGTGARGRYCVDGSIGTVACNAIT